jgi:6-phosphogluconate dehydrogenase
MKVIAALRNQFGGHAVTSAKGSTEKDIESGLPHGAIVEPSTGTGREQPPG